MTVWGARLPSNRDAKRRCKAKALSMLVPSTNWIVSARKIGRKSSVKRFFRSRDRTLVGTPPMTNGTATGTAVGSAETNGAVNDNTHIERTANQFRQRVKQSGYFD